MSDYRAIAAVSRSLRTLLRDRMADSVEVTIAPPDVSITGITGRRLNLYCYCITENEYLQNQEIPGHGNSGAYGHPPLSLNLHYLLTGYGGNESTPDADLMAQELLGDAMQVLHDFAVITPGLRQGNDPAQPRILDASLVGEFERIKVTLQPTSLEDLSDLWSALPQSNFRRSVTYQVAVIQMDSRRPRRLPRPVGEPPPAGPRVFVVPLQRPLIESVRVRRPGDPPDRERTQPYARVGDTLILRGRHLAGDSVRVLLGGLAVPVTPAVPERIELTVPDDLLPGGVPIEPERHLQPGPHSVEVVVGVAVLPQTGFPSNPAVFMLAPRVDGLASNLGAVPRTLTVNGARLFSDTLSGQTLVGNALMPAAAYQPAGPAQIGMTLPDTLPAWPVQALVSGSLAPFPVLAPPLAMQLTLGGDGPHTVTLAALPADWHRAALELQTAIRAAPGAGPAFRGARVGVIVADARLVVVPGGLGAATVITFSGSLAPQLNLTGGNGEALTAVYLSGALSPFPVLTTLQPAVSFSVAGVTHTVTLPARPGSSTEAAALLEAAIRGFPEAGFANARVIDLGAQLLVLPGAAGAVVFAAVAGGDAATVVELQLAASYRVRVRVNGAESVDDVNLDLPS